MSIFYKGVKIIPCACVCVLYIKDRKAMQRLNWERIDIILVFEILVVGEVGKLDSFES